jgi:hypothetical protein
VKWNVHRRWRPSQWRPTLQGFHLSRDSWSRERRVVGKAEWMTPSQAEADDTTQREKKKKKKKAKRAQLGNPRFIVTSADKTTHGALYENFYCARGEMENRIKECQLDLFADRISCGPCAPISCACGSRPSLMC